MGGGAVQAHARLTQLQQPAFSVWIEESMRQIVAIVFRDLKRLILDTFIQVLEGRGTASQDCTEKQASLLPPAHNHHAA